MSTEDATVNASAERKAQIIRLLRKTFFVTLAILIFKISRRYLTTHSEDVGHFVKELQDNGMTMDDAVQRLLIMTMISLAVIVLVIVVVLRWKALEGKVFFLFYFLLLDCIVMYFFPNVFRALFGL